MNVVSTEIVISAVIFIGAILPLLKIIFDMGQLKNSVDQNRKDIDGLGCKIKSLDLLSGAYIEKTFDSLRNNDKNHESEISILKENLARLEGKIDTLLIRQKINND